MRVHEISIRTKHRSILKRDKRVYIILCETYHYHFLHCYFALQWEFGWNLYGYLNLPYLNCKWDRALDRNIINIYTHTYSYAYNTPCSYDTSYQPCMLYISPLLTLPPRIESVSFNVQSCITCLYYLYKSIVKDTRYLWHTVSHLRTLILSQYISPMP